MRYLFVIMLLWSASGMRAQDIIVKKDLTEIEAKVEEISAYEVRYRKASSPRGAIYTLSTEEVAQIRYPNGAVDEFDPQVQIEREVATTTRPGRDQSHRTIMVAKPAEMPAIEGKRRYFKDETPVELPAQTMTGLDIPRERASQMVRDTREPSAYVGTYEWRAAEYVDKIAARVAWKIEYDNVKLIAKEWTGHAWRSYPSLGEKVTLKKERLFVDGKEVGRFALIERDNRIIPGLLVGGKDERVLFLMKIAENE